jgi:hypothetical protein
MKKSLYDISWKVTEPEYRQDPALSQSTLSSYERGGFENIDKLFEPFESPSLTFGSCVDTLITDGEEAFASRFYISDMPKIAPSAEPVIKQLYEMFHGSYTNIKDIPDSEVMPVVSQTGYMANTNYKPETKCKKIREEGAHYYQTMFMAGDKTIVPQDVYNKVFACVRALKDSPQTSKYFCANDPFSDVERFYQLKFKEQLGDEVYRGMLDLVLVDHKNKVIIPCDLKTSHNREYNFPKSFVEFRYDLQARLYWRLLRTAMDKDDYFKDFKLANFRFIVVNNFDAPNPLVWEFEKTQAVGMIELGNRKLRDPEVIGKELYGYLREKPTVPNNIRVVGTNSIEQWFSEH